MHTFWVIAHLFGVAVGAGGAYASDFMFFASVKDRRISGTEVRFLKLGSRMVWIGLAILFVSGIGLFLADPERYLASAKFLAKMTIVAVIASNGIYFHLFHIPHIVKYAAREYPFSNKFKRERSLLLGSGAVSLISWSFAIVLGALRTVPYSYSIIMSGYLAALALGVAAALLFGPRMLSPRNE